MVKMEKNMSNKNVDYRILITNNGQFYKIGHIIINRFEGDFYYTPSQQQIINFSSGCQNKIIDHVAWHKDGRIHIKTKDGKYYNVESRQKVNEIGYQDIVVDKVENYKKLPKRTKKKLDVVFDADKYIGPIEFKFSVVSGKLIVGHYNDVSVPIKCSDTRIDNNFLAKKDRCLGHESRNADKLLQYILKKYVASEKLLTGRQLFIPGNLNIINKISKDV